MKATPWEISWNWAWWSTVVWRFHLVLVIPQACLLFFGLVVGSLCLWLLLPPLCELVLTSFRTFLGDHYSSFFRTRTRLFIANDLCEFLFSSTGHWPPLPNHRPPRVVNMAIRCQDHPFMSAPRGQAPQLKLSRSENLGSWMIVPLHWWNHGDCWEL